MSHLQPLFRLLLATLLLGLALGASAQTQTKNADYRLTTGDRIRINVFQNPDLSIETQIPASGTISYPLIGYVRLGDLTTAEAEKILSTRLRDGGFVQKPQINILIVEAKGNLASVLGQVNRPGRFPIDIGATRVSDLLAMAGGAMTGASEVVILSGERNGKPFRKSIDLPALLQNGTSEQDIRVDSGDTLFVDRAPVFYIYGEVQRPGAYPLLRNMTVLQGLAQGGGLTPRGTERGLRVHRRGPDGKVNIISPQKSDPIVADDVIYLQESAF